MIQKKICMLGSFAVGKTSLVRRFVQGLFSDTYQTTVGVKIDKKIVELPRETLNLILWDFAGKDEFACVRPSHLRGASGCILVADCARDGTLPTALGLHQALIQVVGDVPCILALNKSDLVDDVESKTVAAGALFGGAVGVQPSSAKTGDGVERLFETLARRMLGGDHD